MTAELADDCLVVLSILPLDLFHLVVAVQLPLHILIVVELAAKVLSLPDVVRSFVFKEEVTGDLAAEGPGVLDSIHSSLYG